MMSLPKFTCYTDHTSKNYGLNSLCFEVSGREFYFSYSTLVAFRGRDGRLRVTRNYWGPTTGKHLNAIDREHAKDRLSAEDFQKAYETEMAAE